MSGKTNSRSRSFNAGTVASNNDDDVGPLRKSSNTTLLVGRPPPSSSSDYCPNKDVIVDDYDNEYNVLVRRMSSAVPFYHDQQQQLPSVRRVSQLSSGVVSSQGLPPELVITSSSRIPAQSPPSLLPPPPPYSRGNKVDFFIPNYQRDDDLGHRLRYTNTRQTNHLPPHYYYARRKTIQIENALPVTSGRLKQEDRRWSSDTVGRVGDTAGRVGDTVGRVGDPVGRAVGRTGEPAGRTGDLVGRTGDPARRFGDPGDRRQPWTTHRLPSLAIVTSSSPTGSPPATGRTGRRLSGPELLPPPQEEVYVPQRHRSTNLLSVPGDDVPSTRSRSHSTPSSPELIQTRGRTVTAPDTPADQYYQNCDQYYSSELSPDQVCPQSISADQYSKSGRRYSKSRSPDQYSRPRSPDQYSKLQSPDQYSKLQSPDRYYSGTLSPDQYSSSQEDVMHSPYQGRRRRTDVHDHGLCPDDHEATGQLRKHSYVDVPSGQRSRQLAELRRIASSATCGLNINPDNGPQQRRRVLPPTPDQLFQHPINYRPPGGLERTVAEDRRISSSASSLPSQQAYGYESRLDSNSRRSSGGRQIASNDIDGHHTRLEKAERASAQRVLHLNDCDEERTDSGTFRTARRHTAISDQAIMPSSGSSSRCSSPRSAGRPRKLPETPPDPKSPSKTMPTPPISRQRTMGDLLRQPQQSPTIQERHQPPPRRVSEQIFTQGNAKMKVTRQETKSASSDPGKVYSKSSDPYPFQIPPSRSSIGQYHQNSVSSSSSVPELITSPSTATAGPVTAAVDATTDSGHGSGAESAVGDGATVSGSNSWPDAIAVNGTIPTQGPRPSVTQIDGLLAPASVGLGVVHFTVQYFPVRKRLRISVIKAERLAGQLRMDLELHTFVKLCLMPGKLQKQRGSRIVKRTRDATFNEEFFFDNVTMEDMETKSVNLRLCHHVGKQFQKNVVIGQLDSPLKEIAGQLMAKQEVKLCQELKPKQLKKLGRLQISTCLESEACRLTINVVRVDDLPKFGISGPPDPCVRITVDQNGKIQTKQSRTLKSTCNAVFREAVMFLVSTKTEDIETTNVVITVHDTARSASGDDVIGRVYLGQLASDKMEIDQWRNTITNPGREFKATHQLKREHADGEADNF